MTPLTATTDFEQLRTHWGDLAWVELEPGVGAWLVMGYQEILTVTRQEKLYSRDARNWRLFQEGVVPPDSGLGPMMFWRPNVIGADGAEHRRLRRPLDDGVAAIDQRRMRRSVEELCAGLIAGFRDRGEADLVGEYAAVIPMLAIADLFGLGAGQGHELPAALRALFGSAEDSQDGNRRFEEILGGVMNARRQEPADDLTSRFLRHRDLRGEAEVLQSMVVMISAAQETTTTWISQTLRLMLTDPRFAGRMRGGRLGVDDALDEVLWRDPPMTNMPARYALRDTELGGRRIARGDALVLGLAAANADPRAHRPPDPRAHRPPDPRAPYGQDQSGARHGRDQSGARHGRDQSGARHGRARPGAAPGRDQSGAAPAIELGNRAHLAWSAGPHVCPAPVPARVIARTAVETALHLLPDVRLAVPPAELTPYPSPWTRCPAALPVVFGDC
ncbi:cytochrome P450 [Nonomuraea typhae]|uniref:Cytochrome P450 n=1 Tax=Nonomuraea typhae TaxID=2603600 RepID=A0ABW7Z4E9_9ACTN